MATKAEELRQLAQTIKNETEVGGNTAERVGSAFEGVADALDGTQATQELEQVVAQVQQEAEEAVAKVQQLVDNLPVVQQTGDSTTSVMSQKAVTDNTLIFDAGTLAEITDGTDDDYKQAAINSVPTSLQKGGLTVLYTPFGGTEKKSIYLAISSWSTDSNNWQQGSKADADGVHYDNTATNINADNVQSALDYVIENVDKNKTRESLKFRLMEKPNKAIDTSGVLVDFSGKQVAGDFLLLQQGETLKFTARQNKGYNLISFYSSKDEAAYLFGVEGLGYNVDADYEYTAIKDVYFRISYCYNDNVYPRYFSIYYDIVNNSDDIFKEYTIPGTTDFGFNTDGTYLNRAQTDSGILYVKDRDYVEVFIPSEATNGADVVMLNALTGSEATGSAIDTSMQIIYSLTGGETKKLKTFGANIMLVSGSTDQKPNVFPFTAKLLDLSVKTIAEDNYTTRYVETQPISVPIEFSGFADSGLIELPPNAYKISYKLIVSNTHPCQFYDENKNLIGRWGYFSEATYEKAEDILYGAKYYSYRVKYNTSSYYIRFLCRELSSMNGLNAKVTELSTKVANSGYKYLADGYGVLTTNEDNTEALQALVDKVNFNGGGIIELGVGAFNVAGQIAWKSNVGLVGQGQNVTIIKNTATSGALQGTFYGDNVNNISFRDFTIDASESTTGKGIFIRYIEDGVFENLRIIGTIPTGLGIDFIDRVKILNCNIIGCGRGRWTVVTSGVGCSGIGIGTGWEGHQENFIISNCVCDGNYNNGIFVEDQGRFGTTVMADGTGQVIANNICRNGKNCGFSIWGGKNVTFANNISYNNSGAAFEIGYYAIDGMFIGNQAISCATGFRIGSISHDSDNILFMNNEVRANKGAGADITTGSLTNHIVIKGNEFIGNPTAVKISGDSTGLVIAENNEIGSTTNSFNIAGTHTDAVVRGNTYMTAETHSATYSGETKWVEQFKG